MDKHLWTRQRQSRSFVSARRAGICDKSRGLFFYPKVERRIYCRFGGPHYYFGELFDKPYIGENARELTTADMQKAVRINRTAEVLAIILLFIVYSL